MKSRLGFIRLLQRGILWAGLGLPLHLVWEIAQLPLYEIRRNNADYVAYSILHCTLGDGLIAGVAFIVTGLALRTGDWIAQRTYAGAILLTILGVAYTIFSEWHNVTILASWKYAQTMPTFFGIGLSPVLQWLILPAVTLFVWRALAKQELRLR